MNVSEIDTICASLPGSAVRYPFESSPDLRAWCIGKRRFAWCATLRSPLTVQLKVEPALIPFLIDSYPWIEPGYHMNKRHWVTVVLAEADSSVLTGLLEDAHALVADGLPRAERLRLYQD